MKKYTITLFILFFCVFAGARIYEELKPVYIQPSKQNIGNADSGYQYLIYGDILKSGVPYSFFKMANGKSKNRLHREGKSASVSYEYNVVNANGIEMVVPTCLMCHAQVFEDSLILGLGNTLLDFSEISNARYKGAEMMLKKIAPKKYKQAEAFFTSYKTVYPEIETEVRGVNPADKLALVLGAHRNPETLEWTDSTYFDVPKETIPSDVPAWWLLKKKNAMFYAGVGRGDFGKYLMLSNILTVKDTAEAREVYTHFDDVQAYIRSIEAPKYTREVDKRLARKGERLFNKICSKCHGTYGKNESYPNLLIPQEIVQTDPALSAFAYEGDSALAWFNNSWFSKGDYAAKMTPTTGYIAPPLDGVWITAPYFHNGSVPTIEGVLNSKARPKYWTRNYDSLYYDYHSLGWGYKTHEKAIPKLTYNTTLKGYGNQGHYFADHLSDNERFAIIEYLKTL